MDEMVGPIHRLIDAGILKQCKRGTGCVDAYNGVQGVYGS